MKNKKNNTVWGVIIDFWVSKLVSQNIFAKQNILVVMLIDILQLNYKFVWERRDRQNQANGWISVELWTDWNRNLLYVLNEELFCLDCFLHLFSCGFRYDHYNSYALKHVKHAKYILRTRNECVSCENGVTVTVCHHRHEVAFNVHESKLCVIEISCYAACRAITFTRQIERIKRKKNEVIMKSVFIYV